MPSDNPTTDYRVIYRTGSGPQDFTWVKAMATYPEPQAIMYAKELTRLGREVLIVDNDVLESVGLPTAFEPDAGMYKEQRQ